MGRSHSHSHPRPSLFSSPLPLLLVSATPPYLDKDNDKRTVLSSIGLDVDLAVVRPRLSAPRRASKRQLEAYARDCSNGQYRGIATPKLARQHCPVSTAYQMVDGTTGRDGHGDKAALAPENKAVEERGCGGVVEAGEPQESKMKVGPHTKAIRPSVRPSAGGAQPGASVAGEADRADADSHSSASSFKHPLLF